MKYVPCSLALAFLALFLGGCTMGLSGGSVPIGTIDGAVYLPNARAETVYGITVQARDSAGKLLASTTTGANGHFTFSAIPAGELTLTASAAARSAKVRFTLAGGESAAVGLVLTTFDPAVTSLTPRSQEPMTSGGIEIDQGSQSDLAFDGQASGGTTIPNLPVSWAVLGGVGEFTADGAFHASPQQGNGTLIVQYGNISKLVNVSITPQGAANGR